MEFIFDPATEYQVLEEFEFQESIERPAEIRFFTFTEQTTDFLEKLLPRTGKIAKGIIRRAEHEVDVFSMLYKNTLVENVDGYEQRKYSAPNSLPWVHYVNNGALQKTSYAWKTKWLPLYETGMGLVPNYYITLLDSLPKSAYYLTDGEVPLYTNGMTKINDLVFLDNFYYNRTTFREDGNYSILKTPREGTRDEGKFTGYSVDTPPIEPPNPIADHIFLSKHETPVTIESTEKLSVLLPDLPTILDHAVPETNDPYVEGKKYLRVYDLKLKDIPHELWIRKFPQVPLVTDTYIPVDLSFPVPDERAPAKVLLDAYMNNYYVGMSSRKWLSQQEDGGTLVSKLLLSKAGAVGVVSIPPPVVFPEASIIHGTANECLPSEITDFNDFSIRGIYRPPKCASCGAVGHPGKECPDKKVSKDYLPGYGCFPLTYIDIEKELSLYNGKLPWSPGLDASLVKEHLDEMKLHLQYITQVFQKYASSSAPGLLNETRKLIISILNDDTKLPEDQLFEITQLLKDATLENHIYKHSDGSFLICEHQLDILRGEFDKDNAGFLRKWCVKADGFYVCQYSGERIAEIIQQQDQFDEQGRVVNRHDKIDSALKFLPKEHLSFAVSLRELQSKFKTNQPAEDILYLMMTLLQILPDEKYLNMMLSYLRGETDKVNTKLAGKKLSAKQQGDVDMVLSVMGFNAMLLLLQIHVPQLIPRRSFGRPLVLRGYPRDVEDINDAPLIDGLLNVLQKTFESYPSTFRGASVVFLRTLLNDKKSVKKLILSGLQKQFVPKFKEQLMIARDTMESVAVGYVIQQSFQPPILKSKKDNTFLKPSDSVLVAPETRFEFQSYLPHMTAIRPYSFVQPTLQIVERIRTTEKATILEPSVSVEEDYVPTKDEIRRRIRIDAPPGVFLKRLVALNSVGDLQNVILRLFTLCIEEGNPSDRTKNYIENTRPEVANSYDDLALLRDYRKGILLEFLSISLNPNFERAIQKDIYIRSMLSTAEENRKTIDTLSAREREEFKVRLRRMPDTQREITKTLIDLHLAPYLITKDDREMFVKELQTELEPPTDNPLDAPGEQEPPENVPEEGLHDERDIGPQGEVPVNGEQELEYDYGDYGDLRSRTQAGEEAQEQQGYVLEEDFPL